MINLLLGWAGKSCRFVARSVAEPCNTPRVSATKNNAVSMLKTLPRAAKHFHIGTEVALFVAEKDSHSHPSPTHGSASYSAVPAQCLAPTNMHKQVSLTTQEWIASEQLVVPWIVESGRQCAGGYMATEGRRGAESDCGLWLGTYQPSDVSRKVNPPCPLASLL